VLPFWLTISRQVQQWTSDLHWFCPRDVDTDPDGYYFPEDLIDQKVDDNDKAREERETKCEGARHRTQLVFKALQLFAFDGSDAADYQSWLEEQLASQMQRCDICIREYHRGRRRFKEELTE
jgi:senataxin